MSRAPRLRRTACAAIAAAALAACGVPAPGDRVASGGTGGTGIDGGGSGGTGIAYGSVTGFGSVIVNGVRFDTTGTIVTLDGVPGPDETTDPHRGLREGMVVRVEGPIEPDAMTGTATRISYGGNVEGPIEALAEIDPNTLEAKVLGRTILVHGWTVFEGTAFAALADGNVIEVSGLVDEQARIHATYVEWKGDAFQYGMTIGIRGTVDDLDANARTFRIGTQLVDYASATLPGAAPVEGSFVSVKGGSFGGGGELIATGIEPEVEGIGALDAEAAEIEGFVTAVNGPGDFVLGNQRFVTTATTVFHGGLITDIGLGTRLEVEGTLTAGRLTAGRVQFRDGIELESAVADAAADRLTLLGLPGITVHLNRLTRIEGFSSRDPLGAGHCVKIRARMVGGQVIATKIEKKDVDPEKTEVGLQGPVSAINGPTLVILGVEVVTSGADLLDATGRRVVPEQFLAALSPYDLVEAEGRLREDGTVRWSEVALED